MTKKKRWYRLDKQPDYIMRLLSPGLASIYRKHQEAKKVGLIKKLIKFKNSETFLIIFKIAKLLWRLFKKDINDGSDQDR